MTSFCYVNTVRKGRSYLKRNVYLDLVEKINHACLTEMKEGNRTKFHCLFGHRRMNSSSSSRPVMRSGTRYDVGALSSVSIVWFGCFLLFAPFRIDLASGCLCILRVFSKATFRRSIGSSSGKCLLENNSQQDQPWLWVIISLMCEICDYG